MEANTDTDEVVETIMVDIEPDWEDVIEWYVDCLHHNYLNEEGMKLARKEILRVAKIAGVVRRAQKFSPERFRILWSEIEKIGGRDEEE
jgi:hypothetical protein|tara:strand:- start:52 stop:318 length:267 start_codon:yes stop_codon:yes gene_type:complete